MHARPSSSHGRYSTSTAAPSGVVTHVTVQTTGTKPLPSNPPPPKPIRPQTAPLSPPGHHHANSSIGGSEAAAAMALPRCRLLRAVKPEVVIPNLPALRDTPPGLARRSLLLKKLRLCCYLFDSSPATLLRLSRLSLREQESDAKMRETKRMTMLELINYYTLFKPVLNHEEYSAIFDMLAWNLFRPLPPSSFELHVFGNPRGISSTSGAGYNFSPEEDQQQEDPNWGHIQIAYEFLLRLVSFTPTAANVGAQPVTKENPYPEPACTMQQLQTSHKLLYNTFLSRRVILSLLQNFGSEDIRERDYLKTILHRIYGSSMALRPFIRRNIQHILLKTIYEDEKQHGISELLEILGSIINGFALPLKETHVETLLVKILLPLHKITHLSLFHPQLSYCIMQFIEKDPKLANVILLHFLKIWPIKNSKKEVLFLNEIEEILERVPEMAQERVLDVSVLKVLMSKIAACVYSPHFQVSEKGIYLFNSGLLSKFVFFGSRDNKQTPMKDYRELILPIIARAIFVNTEIPVLNSLDPSLSPHIASHTNSSNGAVDPKSSKRINAAPDATKIDPLLADTPRGGSGSSLFAKPPSVGADGSPIKGHWNSTIAELTQDVTKVLEEFDAPLWKKCLAEVRKEFMVATSSTLHLNTAQRKLLIPTTVNLATAIKDTNHLQLKTYTPTPTKAAWGER